MPAPVWGERFQRLVLALAVHRDWPERIPVLGAALFGSLAPNATAQAPRQRIAAVLGGYWGEYHAPPGLEVADHLIRQETQRVSGEERTGLLREWEQIAALGLPDDVTYVESQLVEWAVYHQYAAALVQGAAMLEHPDRDFAGIRAFLDAALAGPATAEPALERLVGDAAARGLAWRMGEEMGTKVPTGLTRLDTALGGGVRLGESFYFLGPPKGAKSTFLLAALLGAVRRRFGALFVSYEMRARRVLYRADRALTRSSAVELQADPGRLDRAIRGLRAAGAGELYVLESSPQQASACAEAARWVQKIRKVGGRVEVVALDYLNIMGSARNEREKRHELARISREVAALAKAEAVAVWSAALVRRQAVDKRIIRKSDIAEAFEVIAVLDGAVAICADAEYRAAGLRHLYGTAFREEADERSCGVYAVDSARMVITSAAEIPEGDTAPADKEGKAE